MPCRHLAIVLFVALSSALLISPLASGEVTNWGMGTPVTVTVRVTSGTVQSIPNAIWTIVNFDLEDFDTASMHDNVTNNSRLKALSGGTYLLTSTVSLVVNASGSRYSSYRVNGGARISMMSAHGDTTFQARMTGSSVLKLSVNDYVEIELFQDSGAALDTSVNGMHATLTRLGN